MKLRPSGVTLPSPVFVTRSLRTCGLNTMCAVLSASIVSVQVVAVMADRQSPSHSATRYPAAGVTCTVTLVPPR